MFHDYHRLSRHRPSVVSYRGQRVYISDVGAQPSLSAVATDGSEDNDLLSGIDGY